MPRSTLTLPTLLFLLFSASAAIAGPFKTEEWTDTQGATFKGAPSDVLGPLAVFRTSLTTGRHLAFHFLAPEQCVRFYEAVKGVHARADDWANAKSPVSSDLKGRVSRVIDGKLQGVELKGREPEFYIVFFASNGEGNSWGMMGGAIELYRKLKAVLPEEFEAVFFGIRHNAYEHGEMAKTLQLPWLVCDLRNENLMDTLSPFAPGSGYAMVVMTRNGTPLFAAANPDATKVKELFAGLAALLDLMRPDNPQGWGDRAHYLRAIQPIAHPTGYTAPVLVGNPLRADGLVQRKVFRFDAAITVGADGAITGVKMLPNGDLPEKMSAPIANALKKGVFAPAVQDGRCVEGVYSYHFEAPK